MSCDPVRPCGVEVPALAVVPPRPGLRYLTRRLGRYQDFLDDLVATVEALAIDGGGPGDRLLGDRWDLPADPPAMLLAELWALVADSVATYSELTASEAYLGTASDWTDLRRLADLVGYAPRPGVAARGWVEVEIERGASPLVPAGTRVQAPALAPARPRSQLFEVEADTQLRADWGGLTATWVPQPAVPTGRSVRFLGDPGFSVGDRVLFVLEQPGVSLSAGYSWFDYWSWLLQLIFLLATPTSTPLAVAKVLKRRSELGTTVVDFDRDLDRILPSVDRPYAAYRITATAGSARHLTKVLNIAGGSATPINLSGGAYTTPDAVTPTSVVLDAALDDLSAGQLVAVVDWDNAAGPKSDIVRVDKHAIVQWEAAPGSPTRVSKLSFAASVPTLVLPSGEVTVHVLDRRQVARHYEFPASQPAGSPAQLRLFPAPAVVPRRVAVDVTTVPGTPDWRLVEVQAAAVQEQPGAAGSDVPVGLTVDIGAASAPPPLAGRAPASANLVPVRHGATASATLGSGDGFQAGQRLAVPDAPVAYDVDTTGTVVPSLVARADGVAWTEVPTLYGTGPATVFATELGPDGSVVLVFGDGEQGRRLPSGRNNVSARYRVGGGTAGEVPSGAITALVGSVRGVKKVRGAGPTTGGADQDAEGDLRRLIPARARAFGRVVSEADVADLALSYAGVSHAAVWRGAGPPGCPCGGVGLHVAVLRRGAGGGPRPAEAPELAALAAFLDGRRDTLVPLCVCAGTVTLVSVTATLVVDPRRVAAEVGAAAAAGLADPSGPLSPGERRQGQALDRSDLLAVLHAPAGVVGVVDLSLAGGTLAATVAERELGRQPASRWELLVVAPAPALATVSP
ncbi:MAG TPA: baseplate J/gp47 family protein [Acidimicrobiales bacterium]|nr:baseplate J/gp47 family protein [Acidimicrobiales bacterium]